MPSKTCLLALLLCCRARSAQETSVLDHQVKAKLQGFNGKVTLYAKNLQTGASYAIAPDDPVRTASTIKLAIMVECFFEAAEGKLAWTEPLKVTADEKVSGTGVVQDLSDGDELPVRDMVDLMIVLSDNTATNLILNRIGGNAVNARMAQLGLGQTRVMRKILGDGTNLKPHPSGITDEGAKPENKKWGIGRSSPREMVAILEKLYRGELVSKSASDEMLAVLKRQRDHDGIARDIKDVTIASKSGALDHLRSDVGIVYSKRGPIAMAITVEDIPDIDYTPDNPGDLLISSLSEILINGLGQ
jgi:beta-lactamase class A